MTTGAKNIDNTVRYILVNDLGLTRESVRAQADDIVSQCVNAHMSKINIEQAAAEAVKYTLDKEAWARRKSVLEMVKEAAKKKAAEWVEENVVISSPPVQPAGPAWHLWDEAKCPKGRFFWVVTASHPTPRLAYSELWSETINCVNDASLSGYEEIQDEIVLWTELQAPLFKEPTK